MSCKGCLVCKGSRCELLAVHSFDPLVVRKPEGRRLEASGERLIDLLYPAPEGGDRK